jgi:hypothetical protein
MNFSDMKFSMLAKIGLNQHLSTPEVEPYLTGNVMIDYITAGFKPELIDAGIQQGVIHLHTTREEIRKFKLAMTGKDNFSKGVTLWTIIRTRAINDKERQNITPLLRWSTAKAS